MLKLDPKDRIIIPLDVPNLKEAEQLVRELAPYVGKFKVGLELITAGYAHETCQIVNEFGSSVFYDGKLDDIPNTTAGAVKQITEIEGVDTFNIHISSGPASLLAAVENKAHCQVWGVSVLTSMTNVDCFRTFGKEVAKTVPLLARLGMECGLDGLICSAKDLATLSQYEDLSSLIKVTPGVRPAGSDVGDQKRVMTPGEAVKAGADYLVLGRPITKPASGIPADAAKAIADEIGNALAT